ncbi:heparan sulfate 2-O-sulfotransferase pipe isoform X3 [Drosophila gunungcola]|uniref:heparan sulfate 2-O-sulfotransferase pipe isoform X3 n=1 Tax=Drosophila elegans TaxID=30023 RepID=UPI0007E6CCC3|nr:heparan sulfate 2-O-sulfotransferase pipe isoform X3 [Drosophila elegans]XP_052843959.1 heparan sulfate 2-O-sulfotransferase pipe isoform X3 [Drosophila gunungcola]
MSLNAERSYKMKLRDVENAFKYRRIPYPKRSVELIALLAISCTFFLFMHTNKLNSRLKEMEVKLQPSEFSALGLTGNHISGHDAGKHDDINTLHGTYQYLKSTGQMSSLNVRDLNNTRKAQMELVFFNRVPKVGSQTFMELLRRLSERNNFQFHRDAVQKVETIRLAEDQQQEMAEVISELPEPSVFIKHVCFTNFTKFNLPKPIYLNVVRDPVERVISWFYYVRAPWYFVERKAAFPDLPLPHPAWLKKDFETCVLNGDQECTYTQGVTVEGIGDHRRQSLFFCGHDYECTPFNTVGALERAKFAVEQQYAVVGVLEDLNTTLSVLEKYVPRFFEGVRDIYATSAEYLTKINKNNFKPPVSEHVKDIVRRNFTNEIEFYQFCRQRLHKQYLAAHLPQRIITDSAHLPALIGN